MIAFSWQTLGGKKSLKTERDLQHLLQIDAGVGVKEESRRRRTHLAVHRISKKLRFMRPDHRL